MCLSLGIYPDLSPSLHHTLAGISIIRPSHKSHKQQTRSTFELWGRLPADSWAILLGRSLVAPPAGGGAASQGASRYLLAPPGAQDGLTWCPPGAQDGLTWCPSRRPPGAQGGLTWCPRWPYLVPFPVPSWCPRWPYLVPFPAPSWCPRRPYHVWWSPPPAPSWCPRQPSV